MGKRKASYKPKKRVFIKNQHTDVSSSKNGASADSSHSESLDSVSSECNYIVLDFQILKSMFKVAGSCPSCGDSINIENVTTQKKGWANKLLLYCHVCEWSQPFFSSKHVDIPGEPGQKGYDVNIRSVMAFRETGLGHAALRTFSMIMNITEPVMENAYKNINRKLSIAYSKAAADSMESAAKHFVNETDVIPTDCTVSLDGTWQKRGYDSLNGIVTAIARGNERDKCIDYHIMTKVCKECESWENRRGTTEYASWFADHKICDANHKTSAGSMESEGALTIFRRSVNLYNLRYSHYIGDGDTSSYTKVVESKPYGDEFVINKLECVGHVQKRLGSRLRNLKQKWKGRVLSDGKAISGAGRLTDKAINIMQNYFGMAIRQNDEVYAMKKAIGSVLFHCSEGASDEQRHMFCPRVAGGWCKWQSDKVTGQSTYKPKLSLPVAIKEELKPIFQELSHDSLLEKCLHGSTQNVNECLNGLIWARCPKSTYCGRKVLTIGVCSAIISFNDGISGLKHVFKYLYMDPGKFFTCCAEKKDNQRILLRTRRSSEIGKKQRKKLRAIRKGYVDRNRELEGGDSYKPGSC